LMLHGMQPGNDLFAVYADVTYAFIVGLMIASIAVLILGTAGSFIYARIINVPSRLLAPLILLMTVLGSYAIRNNLLDVWVMLVFGVVGLILNRLKFQPAPLVLGIILGPYIENGLVQSMMIGGASGNVVSYMTLRPISLFLIALCVLSALWPLYLARRQAKKNTDEHPVGSERIDTGINSDKIMGIASIVIAGIALVFTQNLSLHGGVFVYSVAGVLCVLGLVTLIKGFTQPEKIEFFESGLERRRIMMGLLLLALYLVLIPVVGFLYASIIFYLAISFALRDASSTGRFFVRFLPVTLIQAGLVVGALYALFYYVLQVPLPSPLWESM